MEPSSLNLLVAMNCSFIIPVSGSINFICDIDKVAYDYITGTTEGERKDNNNKGTVITSITFTIEMFH